VEPPDPPGLAPPEASSNSFAFSPQAAATAITTKHPVNEESAFRIRVVMSFDSFNTK
jgi:hypothetical protein